MLPSGRVRLARRAWCSSISASSPCDLGVVDQGRQLAGEPDRLGGEVDVAGVALVEHEVEHPHHGGDVAGPIDAGLGDGALGAADALGHRRLGHEVRLRRSGAVVSPPTARSVRATADDGVRSGWAHRK